MCHGGIFSRCGIMTAGVSRIASESHLPHDKPVRSDGKSGICMSLRPITMMMKPSPPSQSTAIVLVVASPPEAPTYSESQVLR